MTEEAQMDFLEGTNWRDLVRRIWGPCTDIQADDILINCTAFPFASPLYTARQLRKIKRAFGRDIDRAKTFVLDKMSYDMG